jgi:2-polyprenyl-3-methyl-5-hydroxy-6-metoxy-1,4-benzoquinol methylase
MNARAVQPILREANEALVYDRRVAKKPVSSDHIDYQKRYFSRPEEKPRMRPGGSRYAERHLEAVLCNLDLEPGAQILEIGCGMGRFSLLLAERGYRVTGVDLSQELLRELRAHDPGHLVQTVCCDAAEIDRFLDGPFDAAVGFFFLHHLEELQAVLGAVAKILRPGATAAFCEPNAYNPLFYLQIMVTRRMTWRGDGGVARMRPGIFEKTFTRSGFSRPRLSRYGLFPPFIANTGIGGRLEEMLESLTPIEPLLAFQVVAGVKQS